MIGLVLTLAAGFAVLAGVALFQINTMQIDAQLRSVASDAVGRAERTVDVAVMTMLDQAFSGGPEQHGGWKNTAAMRAGPLGDYQGSEICAAPGTAVGHGPMAEVAAPRG
ncbi:MAG: hypothetical protein U5L46_01195 [Agrobacterium sp.]|nr:hypothetical protein [Agrobacterium sp.]